MSDSQNRHRKSFEPASRGVGGCLLVAGVVLFFFALAQDDLLAMVMTAVVSALGVLMLRSKRRGASN